MKTGKDIDSIYRDRLKGAKMAPPQDAWDNILSHLPQKEEKKKLFPLWMKFAGVAAVLTLLFTIFDSISNPSAPTDFTINPAYTTTDFKVPEVSNSFNEIMKESGLLLQELIGQSAAMDLQGKQQDLAVTIEQDASEDNIVSENPQPKFEIQVTGTDNFKTPSAEENLTEQLPSANDIAEASSAPEKNEPVSLTHQKGESEGKFILSTRVAPVYFNNFGKGNAVDRNFSQKVTGGEVTFSYGVNVAYEVSEKVNIRSGFHKVDLAYNTREVSYNDVAITNSFGEDLMKTTTLASPSGGTLNQRMGFFEVPLEMEYVILDKKFAVGLIGGGSVLFLEENQVSLNSFGNSTDLGESNSMNKLSFTTNLGLSLGYDVIEQFRFSMEPVIKLQLNTFKNSDNSSPYFFGIYSGFSYKF